MVNDFEVGIELINFFRDWWLRSKLRNSLFPVDELKLVSDVESISIQLRKSNSKAAYWSTALKLETLEGAIVCIGPDDERIIASVPNIKQFRLHVAKYEHKNGQNTHMSIKYMDLKNKKHDFLRLSTVERDEELRKTDVYKAGYRLCQKLKKRYNIDFRYTNRE